MLTTILALLTSVTVVFVTVHARPFPCNLPHLPPPPDRDPQSLQPPFFFPETMSPPPPSMPNVTPPPGRDLRSQQPPILFPETRSSPPPSLPNPNPPPSRDFPSLQPPFFFPEMRSPPPPIRPNITPPPGRDLPQLKPPFFYPEPPPQFLQPASGSMFIQKLIVGAGILAAILVLLLALSKCRGLDPEMTIQAIGSTVEVTTCLSA